MMMQHNEPKDWVLATGETHTVKEFAKTAFEEVGLDWQDYVTTSDKYYRPNEVNYLLGDSKRAQEKLGWFPKLVFHL